MLFLLGKSSLKGNASRRRPPRRGDARRDRPAQRPVTNALVSARGLPDAVLRGGGQRRPGAPAFWTGGGGGRRGRGARGFGRGGGGEGRGAAPPRWEEAPRASCVRQASHQGCLRSVHAPEELEAESRQPHAGEPHAERRTANAERRTPE